LPEGAARAALLQQHGELVRLDAVAVGVDAAHQRTVGVTRALEAHPVPRAPRPPAQRAQRAGDEARQLAEVRLEVQADGLDDEAFVPGPGVHLGVAGGDALGVVQRGEVAVLARQQQPRAHRNALVGEVAQHPRAPVGEVAQPHGDARAQRHEVPHHARVVEEGLELRRVLLVEEVEPRGAHRRGRR
jgi:hypothetical protein